MTMIMTMMIIIIITRRRRRRKTGLGLLQSTRLQEAANSRPSDNAGRISDFVLKLFVRKFSYSIYIVNSALRVGGGQKFIFALGLVMSQIGLIGDKDDDDDDDNNNDDDDDDDDDDNNNNNNNNNNKRYNECGTWNVRLYQ